MGCSKIRTPTGTNPEVRGSNQLRIIINLIKINHPSKLVSHLNKEMGSRPQDHFRQVFFGPSTGSRNEQTVKKIYWKKMEVCR